MLVLLLSYQCGYCAQNNNLSLEERINIALSIKKETLYTCASCNQTKFIASSRNRANIEPINEARDEEIIELGNNEINLAVEQLQLF